MPVFNALWGLGANGNDADALALYPLTEASGTRADRLGTSDLTDNNTVGSGTGVWGEVCADFEASNTELLSAASSAVFDRGDTDWFLNVWVKLESKTAAFMVCKDKGSGARQWRLDYDSASDRFRWFVFDSSNNVAGTVTANTIGSPSVGTWYNITVWHSATDNEVGIRVNGGTAETSATTAAASTGVTGFRVGSGGEGGTEYPYDGLMAALGLWSRVPTTADGSELSGGPEPVTASAQGLAGTAQQGETLTATPAGWGLPSPLDGGTNGDITNGFRWTRSDDDSGTNEADIAGATSSTYTQVEADVGKYLRCWISGTNDGGNDPAADTATPFTDVVAEAAVPAAVAGRARLMKGVG